MNSSASTFIRLNKAIADSGYCARRKADELIAAGRVQVNGQTVTELGTKVNPQSDVITINGHPLPRNDKVYLLFHKPVGYVTSRRGGKKDGKAQKAIYELIPPHLQSVDPAGRLDRDSSGALILSNDGDFLFRVTHPSFHFPKVYEVGLSESLTGEEIQTLLNGIHLQPEDKLAKMAAVSLVKGKEKVYTMTLISGYNRQIRRMLAALGHRVLALHRVAFGPVQLESLNAGAIRPLTQQELDALQQSASPSPPKKR